LRNGEMNRGRWEKKIRSGNNLHEKDF